MLAAVTASALEAAVEALGLKETHKTRSQVSR